MTDDVEQVRGYARWVATRGVTSFLISTSGRDHADRARLRAVAPASVRHRAPRACSGFTSKDRTSIRRAKARSIRAGCARRTSPSIASWSRRPESHRPDDARAGAAGRPRTHRRGARVGRVAALGHTDATYSEAMRAIERGATHATHCFNAMRPFGHRDPGVLGAVMGSDAVTAELIGDGAHVDSRRRACSFARRAASASC